MMNKTLLAAAAVLFAIPAFANSFAGTPIADGAIDEKGAPSVDSNDHARFNAMRDAAMAYGERSGFASTGSQINESLARDGETLSRTYDFSSLLINGPAGAAVLPPVLVESTDTAAQGGEGKFVHVADAVYQVVETARFVATTPDWRAYLLHSYSQPNPPNADLMPKNWIEGSVWEGSVRDGWERGAKMAQEEHQSDIHRMQRAYQGMVLYSTLLRKGQVSAPVVTASSIDNGEAVRLEIAQ